MKHNSKQTDLFEIKHVQKEHIFYRNLNIMQKINLKANSCGFNRIYYTGIGKHIPLRHDDNYKELNYKWFWHYKKNYYISLSTLLHIKQNFSKLNLTHK